LPKPTLTEIVLAGFSLACVVVVALGSLGWIRLAGALEIGLYPLYSIAAASGWVLGNLYVRRGARVPPLARLVLMPFYLLLPVGPLFLLRAMAPLAQQAAAPLVPWLCVGIVGVFFLVPVTIRPRHLPGSPRIGGSRESSTEGEDSGRRN